MARIRRPVQEFPGWFHSPDGVSSVFDRAEDVPRGWTNNKTETYQAPTVEVPDREHLVWELGKLGVEIDPTWGLAHLKKVLDDRSPPR